TWYYHDDDLPGPDAEIQLALNHLPLANGEMRLTKYLIDKQHSNAFTVWQSMGSPTAPTDAQYAQLVKAGQLATDSTATQTVAVKDGAATLKLTLPRQAVALLSLEW